MNRLNFEGKGFDFFKIHFVNVLLSIVSLTLLYPRALVRDFRYLWSQTYLGGTAFEFQGTIKKVFNGYMKVLLLCVLYLIFAILLMLVLMHFQKGNPDIYFWVTYPLTMLFILIVFPLILHGDLSYFLASTSWRTVRASYTGKLSELISLTLRGNLLSMLTAGIYSPWYSVQLNKYLSENIRFGSLKFGFNGSPKQLFIIYLKGFLLGIVTLGIYNIWYFKEWYDFTVKSIVVRKGDQEFNLHSDATTLEVFEMLVGNILIVMFTLGIGASWAYIRAFRFIINHCVVPDGFNLESIEDEPTEEEPVSPTKKRLDSWNPIFIA
jgi:uncharacterized membrane protein YjgN (DUF898 family)